MEMFLTAELMITILMLAVEKSRTTFLAPLAIGISLTIIHLVGTYSTVAPMTCPGKMETNNFKTFRHQCQRCFGQPSAQSGSRSGQQQLRTGVLDLLHWSNARRSDCSRYPPPAQIPSLSDRQSGTGRRWHRILPRGGFVVTGISISVIRLAPQAKGLGGQGAPPSRHGEAKGGHT